MQAFVVSSLCYRCREQHMLLSIIFSFIPSPSQNVEAADRRETDESILGDLTSKGEGCMVSFCNSKWGKPLPRETGKSHYLYLAQQCSSCQSMLRWIHLLWCSLGTNHLSLKKHQVLPRWILQSSFKTHIYAPEFPYSSLCSEIFERQDVPSLKAF